MEELYKKVESIVKRISYKKNWRFSVGTSRDQFLENVEVRCFCETEDVNDPTKRATIAYPIPFRADHEWTEEGIMMRIKWGIRELEMHESMEWLKLDGVPVDDPHPELKKEWH